MRPEKIFVMKTSFVATHKWKFPALADSVLQMFNCGSVDANAPCSGVRITQNPMAVDLNNETLIAQYLLGELPEEQQIEIEDRAFADKKYLASITAVENDLIDEYVRNELSAPNGSGLRNGFSPRRNAASESSLREPSLV